MDGRAVGVIERGTLYFIRTDWIGRPSFVTNSAGTKVWEATYLPFGGVHTSTGTPLELRFPGQWYQSESGLHQNWMRDYDPTTGRYIQADPLGLVDGASVYGYALQNPGRYVDPRGEKSIQIPVPWPLPSGPLPTLDDWIGGGQELLEWSHKYNPIDLLLQEIVKWCNDCPPCSPHPVGTIGYQGPETHQRGRDAGTPHYHIFEVQQIPVTCQCIWKEATKRITGHHHSLVPVGTVNLTGRGRPPPYP